MVSRRRVKVRVKGLVKAVREVREAVAEGLDAEGKRSLTERIEMLLGEAEAACRAQGGSPRGLPTPSRRAYEYLKGLDVAALPTSDAPMVRKPVVKLQGVVSLERALGEVMTKELTTLLESDDACAGLLARVQRHVRDIEAICSRRGATPAQLEGAGASVYVWLHVLADEGHLRQHLRALARAQRVLKRWLEESWTLDVRLLNMRALWRRRYRDGRVEIKLHQGFMYATEEVWEALGERALADRPGRHPVVEAFVDSAAFEGVVFALATATEDLEEASTQGVVYGLEASFERVNAMYFEGEMVRPRRLRWSQAPTIATFGHYHFGSDELVLSASLDDPDVPAFVVDFVMYHELLHKKHGVQVVDGRRIMHPRAFRRDEARFEEALQAEAMLTALARRLRRE